MANKELSDSEINSFYITIEQLSEIHRVEFKDLLECRVNDKYQQGFIDGMACLMTGAHAFVVEEIE